MGAIWRHVLALVSGVALLLATSLGTSCGPGPKPNPGADNGQPCASDDGCASKHCRNGFCCASGSDCCSKPADCPSTYHQAAVCADTGPQTTCQGAAVEASCTDFVCGPKQVDDDSGCAGQARDCGPYKAVACTNAVDQPVAACATSCTVAADCSTGNTCVGGACVAVKGIGEACAGSGQGTCQDGLKCENGLCCAAGGPACCSGAAQCAGGLTCDTTRSSCFTTCTDFEFSRCASPSSYCKGNACVAKLADGAACGASGECVSNHCDNSVCCSNGSCCLTPASCPASYRQASACTDRTGTTDCQGTRRDATCTSFVCGTVEVADDSGCVGLPHACGRYKAAPCTAAADQPPPTCPTTCTTDADCSAGNICVIVGGAGNCLGGLPGLVWDQGAWDNANWQ